MWNSTKVESYKTLISLKMIKKDVFFTTSIQRQFMKEEEFISPNHIKFSNVHMKKITKTLYK